MSQERFAALMREFAAGFGIDWQGKERHNRAVFRFGKTQVEFRYSAARRVLFLKAQLWKIDPRNERALCLCLLNINGISRHMVTLGDDGQLGLRHRIMLGEKVVAAELEAELRAFLDEASHLHKVFSNRQVAEFLSAEAPELAAAGND
ncbi:MAG: CesT family type III secretion system chaperone [Betaproteobacteria bacterium]|nr:CesT family type III secretion system chaperone [Betaproteobacteria bacterium]